MYNLCIQSALRLHYFPRNRKTPCTQTFLNEYLLPIPHKTNVPTCTLKTLNTLKCALYLFIHNIQIQWLLNFSSINSCVNKNYTQPIKWSVSGVTLLLKANVYSPCVSSWFRLSLKACICLFIYLSVRILYRVVSIRFNLRVVSILIVALTNIILVLEEIYSVWCDWERKKH